MKKKLNRKPVYKKGGESWVSDKMANLPMYQMAGMTPQFPTYQDWVQKSTNTNVFGFPNNVNKNYGKSVTAAPDIYTQPSNVFVKPTIQNAFQSVSYTKPINTNPVNTVPVNNTTPVVTPAPTAEQTNTNYNFSGDVSPNIGYSQSPLTLQPQENRLDPNSLNYGETWANNNPLPQMGMNGFSYNPNAVSNLNEVPSDILKQNQEQSSSNNTTSEDTTEPQQFFNPYGGVDIESRLAYGANQLGKGNTAQGILGLASGALGIARTGVGAYAAGNREKYVMNEYNDRVNKAMTPRTMALGEDGGMIDFMQKGGYSYNKTGNIDLNNNDVKQVNKNLQGSGLQFDEEFAKAYFSTELAPPTKTVNSQPKIQNTNIMDITSDGQFTDRKVWRNQKPEWYVGKQEAIEGVDYTTVPYKQWENYKMTPEYNKFQNRDTRVAEFQEGGQAGQDQVMQIIQMYAQMAQQDPQAIMEQLQQMSPEEQQQAIQQMAQAVQQPQEEQQFQKGGEFAKKLTGEYTTPLDENDPTINAEVEKNEFLQSPDGEITKALGETHEKNGTKVNLEGGTRIVSDHLKLGGVNAKHYKENFDLEVKANDTYAKVLDRFTKKSGLQKIVDEQEKVIEQLKKSEEDAQGSSVSESTNNLNKMFLSEKLSELEQEKSPLLEARKALMDDVFQRQEASKPAEESSEEQFQAGGEYKKFYKEYINSPNYKKRLVTQGYTNPEQVKEDRLSNLNKITRSEIDDIGSQYYHSLNTINIDNKELKKYNLNKVTTTAHEYSHGIGSMNIGNADFKKNLTLNSKETQLLNKLNGYSKIDPSKLTLEEKYHLEHDRRPPELKADIDALRFKLKKEGLYDTGNQEFNQDLLNKAKKMFSKDVIINRNFKAFKDKDLIYIMNNIATNEDDFNNNIQYAKQGGEIPQYQGAGSFSPDNQINFYRQAVGLGYTGKNNQGDIQRFMNKVKPQSVLDYFDPEKSNQVLTAKHVDLLKKNAPWTFRNSGVASTKASADYTSEEKNKLRDVYAQGDENGMLKEDYDNFILEGFADNKWDWRAPVIGMSPIAPAGLNTQQISTPQLPNFYREPEKSPATENTEVGKIKYQQEDTKKGLNLMMLPNQAPMMPDSLEGALKITRRYDRVDPMQFSPEQQLGAIKGQEAQAMEQINQLPESQRAGALANLSAITQENLAKVYSDVNRTNLVADNQAQQFNAQTQAQEENARGTDLQSYENKIMRAKATTDADRRGYYNQLQAIDLANYNAVNNTNLLNQMYDNYGYNGSSVEQTQGAPKWNASQATANGIPITNTKKKTTKKRFGGKI